MVLLYIYDSQVQLQQLRDAKAAAPPPISTPLAPGLVSPKSYKKTNTFDTSKTALYSNNNNNAAFDYFEAKPTVVNPLMMSMNSYSSKYPIHDYCGKGDLNKIKEYLFSQKAKANRYVMKLDQQDQNGETPLFLAVKYGTGPSEGSLLY